MIRRLRHWLENPEVIGRPECPILHRWVLFGEASWKPRGRVKLLVHRFMPHADDRDVHDHPRPFWTLCVAGGYDDLVPCPFCGGTTEGPVPYYAEPGDLGGNGAPCSHCTDGLVLGDRVRRGAFRYRPAHHRHRTRAGSGGAWTVVVMGPKVREWGFWRAGEWVHYQLYYRYYGDAMRCP